MKRIYQAIPAHLRVLAGLFILLTLFINCTTRYKIDNNTTFEELKDKRISLHSELLEVSGMDVIAADRIALIEDEHGIVYFYDPQQKKVSSTLEFGDDGDYEAVAEAGNDMYVLRSDGKLYRIENYKSESFKVHTFDLNLPADNNESLCFDEKHNRLLLAPKDDFEHDKHDKSRPVYSFSLEDFTLRHIPVINLSISKLAEHMKEQGLLDKKDDDDPDFHITDIALQPGTGNLFMLSTEQLLVCLDPSGNLLSVQKLDKDRYIQPEGISFFDSENFTISSEGKKGKKHGKPAVIGFFTVDNSKSN